MNKQIGKVALGLALMGTGLYFAFVLSRTHERLADGSFQTHFDHTALYVGVGVALFGAILVVPSEVASALKDARSVIGRRSSMSTPVQKDVPEDRK